MKMNGHQQSGSNATTEALCTTSSLATPAARSNFDTGAHYGNANADHLQLSAFPDGSITLDAVAVAGLVFMIEEEKMARDLYDALFSQTGSLVFDKISDSEQRHMDSLLAVAAKAGVDLSAVSTTAGVFVNAEIQSLYDTLLAQGSVSLDAAYDVGVAVEKADIEDLITYNSSDEISIIGTVYSHLEQASENHLATFSSYAALA